MSKYKFGCRYWQANGRRENKYQEEKKLSDFAFIIFLLMGWM
jgi:hypothetical protein